MSSAQVGLRDGVYLGGALDGRLRLHLGAVDEDGDADRRGDAERVGGLGEDLGGGGALVELDVDAPLDAADADGDGVLRGHCEPPGSWVGMYDS